LCKLASVTKTRTTPYHPMGNGMCERFNRTLLHMLGTLDGEKKSNWKEFVAPVVHAYNSTKHDSTGVSPFYLMFGRHPRLAVDIYLGHDPNGFQPNKTKTAYVRDLKQRLDYAYKLTREAATVSAGRQKKGYDRRTPTITNTIEPGDKVLVKNLVPTGKLDNYWEDGLYVVLTKPNKDIPVYCVQREDGGRKRVLHRNLMMPCPTLFRSTKQQQEVPFKPPKRKPPTAEISPGRNVSSESSSPVNRPKRTRKKPWRINSSEWVT
jgi:hypothetical protein